MKILKLKKKKKKLINKNYSNIIYILIDLKNINNSKKTNNNCKNLKIIYKNESNNINIKFS